jgi:DNA-binding CsgD family transcriptional regulator
MEPVKSGSSIRARDVELTERQRQVLRLISAGKTNGEIGETLGISLDGAKWHVSEILTKLDVSSREEAADWWHANRVSYSPTMRMARAVLFGVARFKLAGGLVALALGGAAVAVTLIALRDHNGGGVPGATPSSSAIVEDVPADCPASPSVVIHPALRPAAGSGPVYMNLGLHPVAGQRTLSCHGPDQLENFPPGWGGQDVIFLVAPSYQQPITLSGASADGSAQLQFTGPSQAVLLPLVAPGPTGFPVQSVTTDGWRVYTPTVQIRLDHPGCYAINLSGPGLDERITFWAGLETVAPTPTPTSSAASATPRPIVEWMPFLRMFGRMYLANGVGFAAGAKPPLSIDPALAGRQVGTVLVNARDPSFDFSQPPPDGSSSFLPAGTPVYALKGYREDFRLLAETDYGWRIFETDGLNGAKTIGDALDIRGKVVSVEARTDGVSGFQTVLGKVTQPDPVSSLVDLVLAQPVAFTGSSTMTNAFPELQLIFRLSDGTSTVRELYVGGWELSQGIPVTQEFFSRVEASFTGAN